ncbi:aminodeoxychorismate lyase [Geobacillus stearothermophilus]|uniref:endolytic transglycosylase MltG n=1 Tax=Geobacillus TaxID=129337 RepID=UPI000504030D|nr:endolytic transglycosylase MltG [Geobacillus sp. FJAT-46040]KFL15925.1 aminodeoxychorismate lyase [Geobacillus stearothermophilus]KFX31946.1 aminodeoxychorismate lyase [Geobacillus stearothermophilus]MED4877817.1 endolytic transglycosylase MltG [Anoxybacillus geothermalis]WJQ09641.1 endolytic transglycosylase MltG [Geobacillus stearothermophilus]
MKKRTMRAFALGLLVATSFIGVSYYHSAPDAPTEAEVQAFLEQRGLVAIAKSEYDQLRRDRQTSAEQPAAQPAKTVYIYRLVIQKGDTPETFAKELEAAGIIQSARTFREYLQQHGLTRSIRPGAYNVRSDMDYAAIGRLIAKP